MLFGVESGSRWSAAMISAELVAKPLVCAVAIRFKVAELFTPMFPTIHTPLVASKVPWLVDAVTNKLPAGSTSRTKTPVAGSGPRFVTVIAKLTFCPDVRRSDVDRFAKFQVGRCGCERHGVLIVFFGQTVARSAIGIELIR